MVDYRQRLPREPQPQPANALFRSTGDRSLFAGRQPGAGHVQDRGPAAQRAAGPPRAPRETIAGHHY